MREIPLLVSRRSGPVYLGMPFRRRTTPRYLFGRERESSGPRQAKEQAQDQEKTFTRRVRERMSRTPAPPEAAKAAWRKRLTNLKSLLDS